MPADIDPLKRATDMADEMRMEADAPELPEPAFRLKWKGGAYYVSEPNIGDTDCYTADQMRAIATDRDSWQKQASQFLDDALEFARQMDEAVKECEALREFADEADVTTQMVIRTFSDRANPPKMLDAFATITMCKKLGEQYAAITQSMEGKT
jgi:DNA-binding phage protein